MSRSGPERRGIPRRGARLALPVLLAFALLTWVAALPGAATAQSKTKLRLYVIDCGESEVLKPERWAEDAPQDVPKKFVVRCYLVKHPRGVLIWGTGLSAGLIDKPEGVVTPNGALRLRVTKSLAVQLERAGFESKDITFVSMSHMHGDHAGNANLFTASTFIIQQEEYDAAFGPDPGKYGFNPDLYGKLKDGQVMKLQGDLDLFGDGSVVILRSPGHTPGHQSLFLDLPRTGPILLSGDLWHFASNRAHKRVPAFNFSREATAASMARIDQYASAHGATVWIEHDAAQHAQILMVPGYYE